MHKTVLLNEAIDNLNVKEDGIYVEAYIPKEILGNI